MLRQLRFVAAFVLAIVLQPAFASTNGLVISQVYGGGGNAGGVYSNDFIEIFNAGSAPVSLVNYSVQYASSTGGSWAVTPLNSGLMLQPGQYFLVQQAIGANSPPQPSLPTPDATGTIAMALGAGKVALVSSVTALTTATPSSPTLVDLVGFGAAATFFEGSGPTATTASPTGALRNDSGCTDTNDNRADFTVLTPTPRNTLSSLHVCGATVNAPIVTTCPSFTVIVGEGGSAIASATDADGIVNLVGIGGQPAGISLSAITPATAPGGMATVSILVAPTVPSGNYPLTLSWSNNQSQTAICTPTVTVGTPTPIPTIQGSGTTSPLAGTRVITQGVVTRVTNNGFFMQDPVGDGNAATSDGIFVFTSTAPTVVAGDLARVSATVTEFNTGATSNADTVSHTITELSTVTAVSRVGSGTITPIAIAFPLDSRDDMERYEHMLVTITGPLSVVQNFFVGAYGQLTLAAQGRTETPTNRLRPGSAALALDADNKRRSIVLEDGLSTMNPSPTPFIGEGNTVRDGDTVASVTGVIDYGLATSSNLDPGSWRIIPTVAPVFTRVNARQTAPDDVGGTIRVASANVLNFFTTFTNGGNADGATSGQGCALGNSVSASNCRGADNITEFIRQRTKIVAELVAINADAVGLMEIQNNGGGAVGNLVAALNAQLGAGTYAAITDPVQGTGTDAIKVAMIYKPGRLTTVGASVSDADPIHNRPPLAQTFADASGATFTLVVNHLKSKSCSGASGSDADLGDLQGCFNASRILQAQRTRAFIASLFPAGPLPPVLLIGDFNSYAQEDPIVNFTSNGYVDEIGRFNTFGYSYNFDGASGRLDQAISSPALSAKVVRAIEWHVNSDEPEQIDYNLEDKQSATCQTCPPDLYSPTPYRASDHDPVVIGILLAPPSAAPPRRR